MPATLRPRATATVLALFAALLTALPVTAREHLVTPLGASPGAAGASRPADGSHDAPWPSLATALDSGAVIGGDTVLLAPGSHGHLVIRRRNFDPPLVIASAPGGRAHADQITVRAASGLILRDLDVWPRPSAKVRRGHVVSTDGDSRAITFRRLDIRSAPDALDYLSWDRETWLARKRPGIRLLASDSWLDDSTITGVGGGGNVGGAGSRITGTEVRGFSVDGFRISGRGAEIRRSTIRDCVDVDDNHDDGIQSWVSDANPDGAVIGITLDSNRILEWTGPPDHPLRCVLQGIGLFDGPYRDWTITNNLIAVRAHHGLSFYNAEGMRVVNNTVVDIANRPDHPNPWIMEHEMSRDRGNLIVNNVASGYRLGRDNPALRRNALIRYPFRDFADPSTGDFRPAADSRLIDAGEASVAPSHDIDGQARPLGSGPDLGAYERR